MKRLPLAIVFLLTFSLHAQQALTFQQCLDMAMANNPQLKAAALDEKIAVVNRRASYGQLLPVVTADGEYRDSQGKEIDSETNLFVIDRVRNYDGSLNANFNLFSGFEALNTIKRAKQEARYNEAFVDRVRNEITIDLAQRFITILYLQEIIDANEQQIQASAKQLEIAQLKFDSGVISESELFKIKSQKASEELVMLTNQNNLTDNLVSVKQIIGLDMQADIVLLKPELQLNEKVMVDDVNQFEITDKAVDIHPAFRMSLLNRDIARTELALSRALRYPTLGLRFFYRSNYDPDDDLDFNTQIDLNTNKGFRISLSVPIFNQFETSSRIKTSKLLYAQSEFNMQAERNRISKEVLKAITDARTSLKKNEASSIAFEFSQKSYDADLLKFELGKININELNLTKMNYSTSQAELIQSKYELLFNNALIRFYAGEAFAL
jgi:outer membrane protein TolC